MQRFRGGKAAALLKPCSFWRLPFSFPAVPRRKGRGSVEAAPTSARCAAAWTVPRRKGRGSVEAMLADATVPADGRFRGGKAAALLKREVALGRPLGVDPGFRGGKAAALLKPFAAGDMDLGLRMVPRRKGRGSVEA